MKQLTEPHKSGLFLPISYLSLPIFSMMVFPASIRASALAEESS
jgi:hypothetical protein